MYRFLLCTRYLRTRFIAIASIISVMLGVATMIVVNSVMSGFQHETYNRLHGILSDLVVESRGMEGIPNPQAVMDEIRDTLGDDVEAMTTNVHVPAMLRFKIRDQWFTRQINLIGIDRDSYAEVGDFSKYLLHPGNRKQVDFALRQGGYDKRIPNAGWAGRRFRVATERRLEQQRARFAALENPPEESPTKDAAATPTEAAESEATNEAVVIDGSADPFLAIQDAEEHEVFDPMREQHAGIVLGYALASERVMNPEGEVVDYFRCRPGDDVQVVFPTVGAPPKAESALYTVVDLYESKMSEYDASFAFVPIEKLQHDRGMVDAVSAIQIRLAEGVDLETAKLRLQERFPAMTSPFFIQSWKDLQGPLLAAVQMETTLLNILLFLIIAVAGFGILATFYMIVVEKTRDIGILKSLGASSRGVMSIFLGYGLSLGVVGSGVGVIMGLLFVANINRIAELIEVITGKEVFDPTVYYFQEIPTIINPVTVLWIIAGAMSIAIGASVLPALRAARLHPVEALRYE